MPLLVIDEENLTADQRQVVEKTASYVKDVLGRDSSGHDWFHALSVWKNAVIIGKAEQANMFVVELGALLHDIADYKYHGGDTTCGPKVARQWLSSLNIDEPVIDQVCEIIETISFKGAKVKVSSMRTLEGKVVQDADRLEAIGAIGVARAFAYGGSRGRLIYDPDVLPELHDSFEKYKSGNGHTINHFYEKLLLLKEKFNTKTGRAIADGRHKFMELFLEQFFNEWAGKA